MDFLSTAGRSVRNSSLEADFTEFAVMPSADTDTFPWFAIQVRPGYESVTTQLLTQKGYTPFLPTHKESRRWSDRTKVLEQPLFPGYVFCRVDLRHRLPVLKTAGVVMILGTGKLPESIPDVQIEALQTIVKSGLKAEPCGFLTLGEKVRLQNGPLRGIEGIVLEVRSLARLIVSVPLLQRSISVEVDRSWVTPLGGKQSPGNTAGQTANA